MAEVLPAEDLRDDSVDDARVALLVDDSRVQRRILRALLEKWGYTVLEAGSGVEALQICRERQVDFIISDWMMPGMTGLEFCAAFREMRRDSYGYFILLTSKSETGEVVNGLEVGADDFLIKPVNGSELRARLAAGERILGMEAELNTKNQLLGAALGELRELYDRIDRDLMQARKIQASLVPDRTLSVGGAHVSMLVKPCGHVGGDLVGAFSPGPNRIGFYNIDVSGHGITSALMTARLAGYLSGRFLDQNIAVEKRYDRFYSLLPPQEVARILNERLLSDRGVEEYFTMAYGVFDITSGVVRLVQAGHPFPVVQRASGEVEFVGQGGPPVGLLPEANYQGFELTLQPGDRLLLYSDGFTEGTDSTGRMLEESGLADLLRPRAAVSGCDLLDDLFWQLAEWRGDSPPDDDVSALLLEFDPR